MAQIIGGYGSPQASGVVASGTDDRTMKVLGDLAMNVIGTQAQKLWVAAAKQGAADYATIQAQNPKDPEGALAKLKEKDKSVHWGMPSAATVGAQNAMADTEASRKIFKLTSSDEFAAMSTEQMQAAVLSISDDIQDPNVKNMVLTKAMQMLPRLTQEHFAAHHKYTQDKLVASTGERLHALTLLGEVEQVAFSLTKEGAPAGMTAASLQRTKADLASRLAATGNIEHAKRFTQDLMLDPTVPEEVKQAASRDVSRNLAIRAERFAESEAGREGAAERLTTLSAFQAGISPFKTVEEVQAYLNEREAAEKRQVNGDSPNFNPKQQEAYIQAWQMGETRKANARVQSDLQLRKNSALTEGINMAAGGANLSDVQEYASRIYGRDAIPSKEDISRGYGNSLYDKLTAGLAGDQEAFNASIAAILQDAGRSEGQSYKPDKVLNAARNFGAGALKGKASPELRTILDQVYSLTSGNPGQRMQTLTYLFGAEDAVAIKEQYETLGPDFGGTPTKDGKIDMNATERYIEEKMRYRAEITPDQVKETRAQMQAEAWPNAIKRFFLGSKMPTEEESLQLLATAGPMISHLLRQGYTNLEAVSEAALENMKRQGFVGSGFGLITPRPDAVRADGSKAMANINDELAVKHGLSNGLNDKAGRRGLDLAIQEEALERYPDYDIEEVNWSLPVYRGENVLFSGIVGGRTMTLVLPLSKISKTAQDAKNLDKRERAVARAKQKRRDDRQRALGLLPPETDDTNTDPRFITPAQRGTMFEGQN